MIRLIVLGVPAPQGSKTAVKRGNRAIVIEGSSKVGRAKHKAWRAAVAEKAADCDQTILDGPVLVRITFRLPKPKSRPKYLRWLDRKPDLDKLIRSTLDGLSDGAVLREDSRVARLEVEKLYALPTEPTGAGVEVVSLSHHNDGYRRIVEW